MDTIAKLWSGQLEPIVYLGKNNNKLREHEKSITTCLDNLESILDKQGAELLEKYKICIEEYISLACEQSFCDGYCLATKITSEAFIGADEIVK
ncbi:MAG: hypothetical protein IJY79_01730 [Clostridia bacterium]|nr:hypothetical protein [Clostridia bacterium]